MHDHPLVRMYEYKWWCEHPALDCGHASNRLLWPDDLGAEPYCPQCVIRQQERIIGDFTARLKSFGTILQGEQAQRALLAMEVETLLNEIRQTFGIGGDEWEAIMARIKPHLSQPSS